MDQLLVHPILLSEDVTKLNEFINEWGAHGIHIAITPRNKLPKIGKALRTPAKSHLQLWGYTTHIRIELILLFFKLPKNKRANNGAPDESQSEEKRIHTCTYCCG